MPRQTYDYLTDETKAVLEDHIKAMAAGLDKSTRHVYGILSGEARDPFAEFRALYLGAAKGGVPRDAWRHELDLIDARYDRGGTRPREATAAFKDKFDGHSNLIGHYMSAIADGSLDAAETEKLLALIAIEKPLTAALETALTAHQVRLMEGGRR